MFKEHSEVELKLKFLFFILACCICRLQHGDGKCKRENTPRRLLQQ